MFPNSDPSVRDINETGETKALKQRSTISAHLGKDRHCVAKIVRNPTPYAKPLQLLEFWNFSFRSGWGSTVINLQPATFYAAKINKRTCGIYVDRPDRLIRCLSREIFYRELFRRFKEGITEVELHGDWLSGDVIRDTILERWNSNYSLMESL